MSCSIEVVMLTHNRLPLLRRSLPALLATLPDNASVRVCAQGCTDGTVEFLGGLDHPRLAVRVEEEGIGLARMKSLVDGSEADVIVTCDDDVWDFSPGWGRVFERALLGPYRIGYACAVPVNGADGGLPEAALKRSVTLEEGVTYHPCAAGGWFTATSRKVRDAAGGFPAADRSRFDIVDALYSRAVLGAGYRFGALGEVRVYHAQSLRAKVEAGLGDRVEEDLRESHRAGWLSDEALEERLAELEEARRAAGR